MEYKCSNCGGELEFEPSIGKLKCPFCGRVYDLADEKADQEKKDEILDHEVHAEETHDHEHDHVHTHSHSTDGTTDTAEDLVTYACPHCGAEVVTDKTTSATTCVFCRTPLVIEEQTSGKFRPQYVVPFAVSKKKIGELYEQYISEKPFYPDEYSSENVISKIQGIYLPYWLYDLRVKGNLLASGEHTTSFRAGKYMVTDHHVYHLSRAGTMDFWKVPVVASSKASEEAMNALEPYDYNKLQKYSPDYLPGFVAQRYDQESDEKAKRSGERAEESFNNAMLRTITGYESVRILNGDMTPSTLASDYALMPAYLLYMDYDRNKGEDGLIAINGQTGKIAGNIPVDPGKRNRYFLRMFLIFSAVLIILSLALEIFID